MDHRRNNMCRRNCVLIVSIISLYLVQGKIESMEIPDDSDGPERDFEIDSEEEPRNITQNNTTEQINNNDEQDPVESGEHIGAAVTQVVMHPYSAALLENNSYICSAVILNTYWLITLSKCFDQDVISSYVTHKRLGNYTIRVGSSYNNKGGSIHKLKMLINNFDLKVSAVKLDAPLEFGPTVRSVRLPNPDDEVTLGYLVSLVAWTPNGHMRVVNAPIIEASICETYTKMLPGYYICVGGVQDPNRHFCRKDHGGAVIQNNTLIGITAFLHSCALYSKTHAFPKVASFARWLDSVIWDEDNRRTTVEPTQRPTTRINKASPNITESPVLNNGIYDPRKFMLTLPFDPINVPLEPAEDNSVIPRMSLYESYLQNMARAKTSTTQDPNAIEEDRADWLQKYGKSVIRMPPAAFAKKLRNYQYS